MTCRIYGAWENGIEEKRERALRPLPTARRRRDSLHGVHVERSPLILVHVLANTGTRVITSALSWILPPDHITSVSSTVRRIPFIIH